MTLPSIEKRERLSDPVVVAGTRVYAISSQNGLFPDPWGGHVPHEMAGVWDHPIKLLDGFWLAVRPAGSGLSGWLTEADACRVYPTHVEHVYRTGPLQVTRRDFVPDGVEGMVITLELRSADRGGEAIEVEAVFRSDLRPAWLGEASGLHDAPDRATIDGAAGVLTFEDTANPWSVVVGAQPDPVCLFEGGQPGGATLAGTHGQGATGSLTCRVTTATDAPSRLTFFVAGSTQGTAAAGATLQQLRRDHQELWDAKQAAYRGVQQQTVLRTPDPQLNEAAQWVKFNCRMLERHVPELGTGAGAGLPTYPWWFGIDTEYAVLPMLQAGLFDLARETLRLIRRASVRVNPDHPGRVIHELTTTGQVPNRGNLVETPAFTRAVHQVWLWTGDQAFLEEMYPFCKTGVLDYTLGTMDPDGDLCPAGRSIMETHEMHAGFETLDIAAYTWAALRGLADMAPAAGDAAAVAHYEALAETLGARLRDEWWLEAEGLFADVRADVRQVRQVLERIETVLLPQDAHRVPAEFMAYLDGLFGAALAARADGPQDVDLPWLLRHWVVLCPLEVGVAAPAQAARAFARLESDEFMGPWGMYLHPTRHDAMSINTGLLALAETTYGRMAQGLDIVSRVAATLPLAMPGAVSEALPNQWCFMQLWSAVAVLSPVVDGFFGVRPRAADGLVRVVPHLPPGWSEAALDQVRVGDTVVDVAVRREANRTVVHVTAGAPLALEVGCYVPGDAVIERVALNGAPVEWTEQVTSAGRCVVCQGVGAASLEVWAS